MEFNFQFDEKVEAWIRTSFTIVAKTKEEAEKQAIEMARDDAGNYFDSYANVTYSYTEVLHDTMVLLKESTYKELTIDNKVIWEAKAEESTTD